MDKDKVTYRELVKEMERLEDKLDRTYTKLVEFEPVRKLVYGVVGITLTAIIGAILALVVRQ